MQSSPNSKIIDAKSLAKFGHAGGDTAHSKSRVLTAVSVLLQSRCPNHIARLVIAIVVHALKAPSILSMTHIGEKRLKGLPPITDFNRSAAVILKGLALRVFASLSHAAPRFKDASVRHSVSKVSEGSYLTVQAAARARMTTVQVSVGNDRLGSAMAPAEAHFPATTGRFNSGRGFFNDSQPPKRSTDKIRLTVSGWVRKLVLHDEFVSLCRVLGCWLQRRDIFILVQRPLTVNR